jgi:hypothetical protein
MAAPTQASAILFRFGKNILEPRSRAARLPALWQAVKFRL